jgi:hypothetical protein
MANDGAWKDDEVRPLLLELLDERLQRYRLVQPRQERTLAQSMERYGQVSPVVICVHEQTMSWSTVSNGFARQGS